MLITIDTDEIEKMVREAHDTGVVHAANGCSMTCREHDHDYDAAEQVRRLLDAQPIKDDRYYWPDGTLKWTYPIDVGHLIAQLQTLDRKMKVSSVIFIDTEDGRKARACGLSMSRERWDESGWLNFQLNVPECLAIWANVREEHAGETKEAP